MSNEVPGQEHDEDGVDEFLDVVPDYPDPQGWPWLTPSEPTWCWTNDPASQHLRTFVQREVPWMTNPDTHPGHRPDAALAALRQMAVLAAAVQEEITLLTVESHFRGASWKQIGESLGCSRQTAHERYRGKAHSEGPYQLFDRDLNDAIGFAARYIDRSDGDEEQRGQCFDLIERDEQSATQDGMTASEFREYLDAMRDRVTYPRRRHLPSRRR